MNWTPELTELRDVLAGLYPEPNRSIRIADETGLPREHVAFHHAAIENWHAILIAAERRGRVAALIEVVRAEYRIGENDAFDKAARSYLDRKRKDFESAAMEVLAGPSQGPVEANNTRLP